ncbi:hypothetical protein GPECTOR_40g578 [Gonium pectorale]|uniref:Uncharacterized protein n=1 Tax=Gonium pectorale TaxID=33097 RepID=A0A150GAI5_GONPE|nr:hypothetical protein GPECTOR_40g578 [Gonium pectorale]|eukprot:KXZ46844.1 hypothetical protein GPECTOR_40g578 [Gonium pectorale]
MLRLGQPVVRIVDPHQAPARRGSGSPSAPNSGLPPLPPDWRRLAMRAGGGLSHFAALPILGLADAGGGAARVVAALVVVGPAGADASAAGGAAVPEAAELNVLSRLLGLAFFSDQQLLYVYLRGATAAL